MDKIFSTGDEVIVIDPISSYKDCKATVEVVHKNHEGISRLQVYSLKFTLSGSKGMFAHYQLKEAPK